MARHVDLGHQHDAPLAAESVQFPHFRLRIVFPGLPCHAFRRIELRVVLALQPPSLVLRQMQMEHIDLELRKNLHLPFQLLQTHIRAPHVHHPPPHPETRPVHDAAAGNPPARFLDSASGSARNDRVGTFSPVRNDRVVVISTKRRSTFVISTKRSAWRNLKLP